MGTGILTELHLELFGFLQLLVRTKSETHKLVYERRKACRRRDRRNKTHRRISRSSDINCDELNRREDDRRNIYADRRRQDRRALERIKKI